MITWDEKKRKRVIRDHGVDFEKIEDVFADPFAIDFVDKEHSIDEPRRAVIAKTAEYGLLLLIYVVEGEAIRFVTARKAERWMVRLYEEQRRRF